MMDDAITLGVNHAAFNLNIATLIRIPPKPEDTVFEADGIKVGIRQDVIDSLPMKLCQEKGIRTYLIILAYRTGNPVIDNLLLHPNMPLKTPNNLGAFNTKTPAGIKAFQSIMDQLCKSFSRPSEKKVLLQVGLLATKSTHITNGITVALAILMKSLSIITKPCASPMRV